MSDITGPTVHWNRSSGLQKYKRFYLRCRWQLEFPWDYFSPAKKRCHTVYLHRLIPPKRRGTPRTAKHKTRHYLFPWSNHRPIKTGMNIHALRNLMESYSTIPQWESNCNTMPQWESNSNTIPPSESKSDTIPPSESKSDTMPPSEIKGDTIPLPLEHLKPWMAMVAQVIVQELCESRGGRPGLSVLTSLLVSVDVKLYWTMLRHWSQLVPNMSTDIWGH